MYSPDKLSLPAANEEGTESCNQHVVNHNTGPLPKVSMTEYRAANALLSVNDPFENPKNIGHFVVTLACLPPLFDLLFRTVLEVCKVVWLVMMHEVGMGCMASSQKISVAAYSVPSKSSLKSTKAETVLSALTRLDDEIAKSERTHPAARLAVVAIELESIHQEIKTFEEITDTVTKDTYAKTIHQLFISLDLYRRPMLASENEDFVANVNRKEMRRLELSWLRTRYTELVRERRVLHAQILRLRSLYAQLQHLLDSIWGTAARPGSAQESALTKALGLRDALAAVSARLRAAAEYAHAAVRLLDDAMPAWKMTTVGKNGWERSAAVADACALLVAARCAERGARRVLAAPAAPRAARALRLALDYAFTDAVHDHKYQRATEIFVQFKDALVLLIDSIHQTIHSQAIIEMVEKHLYFTS